VQMGIAGAGRRFEIGRSSVRVGRFYGTHDLHVSMNGRA
jgi:hypothetical protein